MEKIPSLSKLTLRQLKGLVHYYEQKPFGSSKDELALIHKKRKQIAEHVIKRFPQDPDAQELFGDYLLSNKDKRGIAYLQKAAKSSKGFAHDWINHKIARGYESLGDAKRADEWHLKLALTE